MKQVVVIPARYQSSRLPGKPLALIAGRSLIRRVWDRCVQAIEPSLIFVATDDDRIEDHCKAFGAQVIRTPEDCMTGTDRLFAANRILQADSVINVQGDEPLVLPEDIRFLADSHRENIERILCGMGPLHDESEYRSPTVPKVVAALDGRLLYMSRGPIPSNKAFTYRGGQKQICIYGFSAQHLEAFGLQEKKTPLEELEDIEILRFLEMGYSVQMLAMKSPAIAVDIPDDIHKVEAALLRLGLS